MFKRLDLPSKRTTSDKAMIALDTRPILLTRRARDEDPHATKPMQSVKKQFKSIRNIA